MLRSGRGSPCVSAAGAVLRGALAQNRTRSVLAVLAIALGVALGYAVQLINQAAVNELAQGVQRSPATPISKSAARARGFDEALYPDVARLPGVAVASPVVEVDAKLAGRAETLRILGLDVFRAGAPAAGTDRRRRPTASTCCARTRVFLSPAAARWLGVGPGDVLRFQVGLADVPLRVAGVLAGGGSQRFAVMDIAGAQAALRPARPDHAHRPAPRPGRRRRGVSRRAAARSLPPGLAVERPEASLAASASLSRSYRVNLNVLALVALFTGGLLVFSTQALAVVRRRAQFALLRVLGRHARTARPR